MRWGVCQFLVDPLQHPKTVINHVAVPKTQHSVALPTQQCLTLAVVSLFHVVATVQLDKQFPGKAGKIRNVGAYWLLSTKFVATQLLVAQEVPE